MWIQPVSRVATISAKPDPPAKPDYLALLIRDRTLVGQHDDEQLVDPIAVHVENFDLKSAPLELVADLRNTPQLQHHKPGNGTVGMVIFLG